MGGLIRIVEVDVCIVGSGAAGSVVAERLCRSGLRVAIIEQGQSVGLGTNFDQVISASEPATCRLENGAWGPVGYPWTSCNVGGGPVFYGAASFRLRQVDFRASSLVRGTDLNVDWPIDYATLEPYYSEIEHVLGLSGDGVEADPTHPGGSAPPLPAICPSPQACALGQAGRSLGLSTFATPLMIATLPYRGRPACSFCSPCIEHACASGAKADPFRILALPLLGESGLSVYAGMKAVCFLPSRDARSARMLETVNMQTGARTHFKARAYVLAANAIQTAAVLLRSEQGGSSGFTFSPVLGTGLCMKLNEYVVGYPSLPGAPLADGAPWADGVGPFSTIACTDHYVHPECPTGFGGLIYEARFGWKYGADPTFDVARLECLLADTPTPQNCVRLSSSTDAFGVPLVTIDYRTHPCDRARLEWLVARASKWLTVAGYSTLWREPGGYALGSSHLHGTCRAGDNPATSVVDAEGRVHGVENIYVADGAYMPFPGSVNPTLTIQAIALMVADKLSASLFASRRGAEPAIT